jgi:hypothetical protein
VSDLLGSSARRSCRRWRTAKPIRPPLRHSRPRACVPRHTWVRTQPAAFTRITYRRVRTPFRNGPVHDVPAARARAAGSHAGALGPARAGAALARPRATRSPTRRQSPLQRTRGAPTRPGKVGKNGSTRSHNGSGSSAAAIPVHATSPTRIRFRRFCYTLLAG